MEKITILFIQGGGKGAHKEDKELADFLRRAFGKKYKVLYPVMPGENDPDYDTWKGKLDTVLENIKGPLILVAHSVGGFILVRYLTLQKVSNDIAGIFLIATPFLGERGWRYEGFELDDEFASRLPEAPLFMYHSRDDEMVPFLHLSLYAEKLPQATIRELDGRGHQLNDDLSEVVEDIKSLGSLSNKQ